MFSYGARYDVITCKFSNCHTEERSEAEERTAKLCPCLKAEGLVLCGKARAVRLINSLLFGKNENSPKIQVEFADSFLKKCSVQNHFPKVFC